jgi:hypothetical protein
LSSAINTAISLGIPSPSIWSKLITFQHGSRFHSLAYETGWGGAGSITGAVRLMIAAGA